MDWIKNDRVTRTLLGRKVDVRIVRTPYGATRYSYEAFTRPTGITTQWERIPLSFRGRLRDTMEIAERKHRELNA